MSGAPAQASRPRPSSTVVLLRDAPAGPEVLLVLRHERAAFGASYVFPGGVTEPDDTAVAARCGDADDAQLSRRLGLNEGGLVYFSAAIRELFEETAVLLAHRAADAGEPRLVDDDGCDALRDALNDGSLAWRDLLEQERLTLACDELCYFSHWVTPRFFDKRFSTRFFAARLPQGQHACHDGGELTDSVWLRPSEALAAAADGKLELPRPTERTLATLAAFTDVAAALAWAREQEKGGVPCLLPAVVGDGDERRIVMPGSRDYPADHMGCEE